MARTNMVEKLPVNFCGVVKNVRVTGIKYCGSCKDMMAHICLKPSVFAEVFRNAKTQEVCLGCHEAGRYQGQAPQQFVLPSGRADIRAMAFST